jgi:hypothetical protein
MHCGEKRPMARNLAGFLKEASKRKAGNILIFSTALYTQSGTQVYRYELDQIHSLTFRN